MTKHHAPTPWAICKCELQGAPAGCLSEQKIGLYVEDATGNDVCDLYIHTGPCFDRLPNDEVNAVFIVRAVNVHDDLVAELKFIEQNLRQLAAVFERKRDEVLAGACEGWANRITSLLGKAEGDHINPAEFDAELEFADAPQGGEGA